MNRLKRFGKIIKNTFVEFFQDDAMTKSGSIAFYTIFSLPAILIITVNIGEYVYEGNMVEKYLYQQIQGLIGPGSAERIQEILQKSRQSEVSLLAKIIGIGTLIISATTVFATMQQFINDMWEIEARPRNQIVGYVLTRIFSFAMVVSIGFLLLVSLTIDTFLVIFSDFLANYLSGLTYYVVLVLNYVISFGVVTLIFALLFKVLPDAKTPWRAVWVGAIGTALLFSLGKYLISLYLGNSTVGDAYGAASSLVILLIWVYYSTSIILLGAKFFYVYAKEYGHKIEVSDYAAKKKKPEHTLQTSGS